MRLKLEKTYTTVYTLLRSNGDVYEQTPHLDQAMGILARETVESAYYERWEKSRDPEDLYYTTYITQKRMRTIARLKRFLMWKEKRLEELDSQSEG